MAVKRYKPTSPARRLMTVPAYGEISKQKPERSLLEDQRKSIPTAAHTSRSLRTQTAKSAISSLPSV